MFFRGSCLLVAAFATEVPPLIAEHLASTNETAGSFVQTKTLPSGRRFVSSGTFRIRPGVDFEWAVHDPFETCFYATQERYIYTNEDERVERPLAELPNFARFDQAAAGDYSLFFEVFDALYKEEGGRFYVRARPKRAELKDFLKQVDAEGVPGEWSLTATFPDSTTFTIEVKTDAKEEQK